MSDLIGKCQHIMNLVDDYHERPNSGTRLAIRSALMDGFSTAAAPAEDNPVPDAVWEALQRLIEDGYNGGPTRVEDARAVARHRDRVRFMNAAATSACASLGDVPVIPTIGS